MAFIAERVAPIDLGVFHSSLTILALCRTCWSGRQRMLFEAVLRAVFIEMVQETVPDGDVAMELHSGTDTYEVLRMSPQPGE